MYFLSHNQQQGSGDNNDADDDDDGGSSGGNDNARTLEERAHAVLHEARDIAFEQTQELIRYGTGLYE